MRDCIVVYYDNKFKQVKNVTYFNCTKKQAIEKFNDTIPLDCALINVIII